MSRSRSGDRQLNLSRTRCPERIRDARIARGWTTQDLAERAGVSERTIRQLERRQRSAFLEFTLLQIARALDTPLADLLASPGQPVGDASGARPRRLWRIVAAGALGVLGVFTILALRGPGEPVAVTRTDAGIEARDARRRLVWHQNHAAGVEFCDESPWHDDTILVGLQADAGKGGRVLLLERRSGRLIWSREPDLARMAAAFGELLPEGGGGYVAALWTAVDLAGDGDPEIAISFTHGWWWPSSVLIVARDGRVLAQYDHRGHLYDLLADDVDGDGRQELLACGTNNAPCHQGATVLLLDDVCNHGASLDPCAGGNPDFPDSARARLVLPAFAPALMERIEDVRIEARELHTNHDDQGRCWITLIAGTGRGGLVVTLDAQLRPISAAPTDLLVREAANWPPAIRAAGDPTDQRWIDGVWLPSAARFEAGHWGAARPRVAADGPPDP